MEPRDGIHGAQRSPRPALAKMLLPLLLLGGLGLVGLIWVGSNVLSDVERGLVGNFFQTELDAPGRYEAELQPGVYTLVVFNIEPSDVAVVTGTGASVPLAFGAGRDRDLRQRRGSTTTSVTIAAEQLSELWIDQPGSYAIMLEGDNGIVLTDAFENAPGAASTGGSVFGDGFGIGDAIQKNLLFLLASGAALLAGIVGAFAAWRAKRRHASSVAFQARLAARNADRNLPER